MTHDVNNYPREGRAKQFARAADRPTAGRPKMSGGDGFGKSRRGRSADVAGVSRGGV